MKEKVKIKTVKSNNLQIKVFCKKKSRMLRRLCLLLLLIIGRISVSHALEAAFAHAIYYLPDPVHSGKINPYVEVYWQVNPMKIHYNTNSAKQIIGRILTSVTITNDTGRVIKSDSYIYQTFPCTNVDQLASLNILELKRYFLSTGQFKLEVVLKDLNDSTNVMHYADTVIVDALPANKALYGSIQLVDTSYVSDARTPFRKHGRQVLPLCENFFDTYRDKLNYYTEVYQLDKVSSVDYPLYQKVFISKKNGKDPILAYQKLDTINGRDVPYVDGSFDISDLPSGNYYLTISLGDRQHNTVASASVFFQRSNKKPPRRDTAAVKNAMPDTAIDAVNVLDLTKTFLKKYDDAQVKAILKMLLPVSDQSATYTINGFLKNPDALYMRYYIYNYFQALDKDKPERAWKEYSDKVKEANKLYSKGATPGYETTRGFMYLRYGPPSEVVTADHERGSLPYEIWQYDNLKEMTGRWVANAVILFYKPTEIDPDYRLLHTTIAGEPHNAGWRTFLYTSTEGGTNIDSRAEQYIGNR